MVVDDGFESADASVSGSDDDDEGCGGGGGVDSAERRLNVISRPFPDPLALINRRAERRVTRTFSKGNSQNTGCLNIVLLPLPHSKVRVTCLSRLGKGTFVDGLEIM